MAVVAFLWNEEGESFNVVTYILELSASSGDWGGGPPNGNTHHQMHQLQLKMMSFLKINNYSGPGEILPVVKIQTSFSFFFLNIHVPWCHNCRKERKE